MIYSTEWIEKRRLNKVMYTS